MRTAAMRRDGDGHLRGLHHEDRLFILKVGYLASQVWRYRQQHRFNVGPAPATAVLLGDLGRVTPEEPL